MTNQYKDKLEDRFWEKVDKRSDSECWEWLAGKNANGYGTFKFRGKDGLASRASWVLHNGEIPEHDSYHGLCCLHHCDNPACVNPSHLYLGTPADNNRDMVNRNRSTKGRSYNKGSNHGNAKLTETDVIEIKRMLAYGGLTQQWLADLYKVSRPLISNISSGKLWSHV